MQMYYLTYSWGGGNNFVQTFSKGISPKVDLINCLEFELDYKLLVH